MMNKTNELLNKLNENIERGNRILVVVTAVNILTVLMIGLVLLWCVIFVKGIYTDRNIFVKNVNVKERLKINWTEK